MGICTQFLAILKLHSISASHAYRWVELYTRTRVTTHWSMEVCVLLAPGAGDTPISAPLLAMQTVFRIHVKCFSDSEQSNIAELTH